MDRGVSRSNVVAVSERVTPNHPVRRQRHPRDGAVPRDGEGAIVAAAGIELAVVGGVRIAESLPESDRGDGKLSQRGDILRFKQRIGGVKGLGSDASERQTERKDDSPGQSHG